MALCDSTIALINDHKIKLPAVKLLRQLDSGDLHSTPGVYRIPSSCGEVNVGTTKQDNHNIQFEDTQVFNRTSIYYPRFYRDATEIQRHPKKVNRKQEALV